MHITALIITIKCSYMHFTRYLDNQIYSDLKDRMVFIGGPRQVGKTTAAKKFLKENSMYLTWNDWKIVKL